MKKHSLFIIAVSLVFAACSDFFPAKSANESDGGGGSALVPVTLPEKAELDARACAYPARQSGGVKQEFVWTLATRGACPRVRQMRYEITRLRLGVDQLCLIPGQNAGQDELEQHWRSSMSAIQYLWMTPFPPLTENMGRRKHEIYAWPDYNRHALNHEMLKANEQGGSYKLVAAPSRKGMAAIEQLVFNREALLEPGLGGKLKPEELRFNEQAVEQRSQARCLVLSAMVKEVALNAEYVYRDWDATQGKLADRLWRQAGSAQTQMVLNEISDGLFFIERVKDFKVGLPLGLIDRCRREKCPESLEHVSSDHSIESIGENLEGFKAAMLGAGGPGFVNLLESVGRADMASRFRDHLTKLSALYSVLSTAGSLRDQVIDVDKAQCVAGHAAAPPVCQFYFELKNMVALFKSDFLSALNLQPPQTEADND